MTVVATHAPGTFCWADLGTPDAAAAKRFYTGVFGWSHDDRPMGDGSSYTMFAVGGSSVAALYPQDPPQAPGGFPHWLSYVSVASADRMAERTRALGGTVLMEPFDVFEVGRMAIIRDPAEALLALWEPRTHAGAGIVDEPNAVCWHELLTGDPESAGAFYAGLLGWVPCPAALGGLEYTYLRQGDRPQAGMLEIAPEWGPVPPHWLIYFSVEDCDGRVAAATALGGSVVVPPSDVTGVGRYAVLQDPQGATFAVVRPG